MNSVPSACEKAPHHATERCAATASAPAPAPARLDVVIISWQGQYENAAHIAHALSEAPHLRVVVIYSNAQEVPETGAGEWVQVPNAYFFGWKFRRALECIREDSPATVIVQADARAADWAGLLTRCIERFEGIPNLGLWTPRISYTAVESAACRHCPRRGYGPDARGTDGRYRSWVGQTGRRASSAIGLWRQQSGLGYRLRRGCVQLRAWTDGRAR